MNDTREHDTHLEVQRYYGETLESTDDLKTTACCTAAAPPKYLVSALGEVHDEVQQRYYGCGLVVPEGLEGLTVLDLGCGAGRDAYVLSRLVGPTGRIVGVDMTPAQLEVAERHRDWHAAAFGHPQSNVEFIEGNIERLEETALADQSFDLIVSNCVINLAVDKEAVLRSAYRLLKPGGEMYFSDIYADRRIPAELVSDPVLYGECLAGALYWNDFLHLAEDCGFADPRLVESDPVDVTDEELALRLGDIRFRSVNCRLFRVDGLEQRQENYGQQATYRGSLPHHPDELRLDEQNRFVAGAARSVSGNTVRLLTESRFSDHFEILSEDSGHLGAFSGYIVPDPFAAETGSQPGASCC
jgi:arsenite methyltransferase